MRVIGLTGGIGSGKSQVSAMLSALGAIIIDADMVARQVVKKGSPAWQKIRKEFGERYLLADGEIDRKGLGKLVFSQPKALEKLNHITHPEIKDNIEGRLVALRDQDFKGIVVVEAALLLEVGWDAMVDEVWVIDAPIEQRIERLINRDSLTKAEALKRIDSQMASKERNAQAHRVLRNDSTVDNILKQVHTAWDSIDKEHHIQ